MKLPYIHFYTGEWMKDPAVGMLSPAARGIWMDLLCVMHENDRCGAICGNTQQLARLARCSTDEMAGALNEFELCKTASVTDSNGIVTVVNRRMAREHKERIDNAKRQDDFRERKREKEDVTHPVTAKSHPLSVSVSVQGSDKASKRDADGGEADKPKTNGHTILAERCLEAVRLAEEVLESEWVNDAGKWVSRSKADAGKVFRVMADVKCAKTEGRVKTSPARMAEHNWKVFT